MTAKLMVAKYGKAAPSMARRRARQSSQHRCDGAASAWVAIAETATEQLSGLTIRSPVHGRATLSEVLDGGVTRQMMSADDVSKEDVERLMNQTKRHRDENA